MKPGGMGPWFCGLFVNTSSTSKKQTHVVAHTYLHEVPRIMNRRCTPESHVGWVLIQKIGPIHSWATCVDVIALWTTRTRGKTRRFERGFDIFRQFRETLKQPLYIWCISVPQPLLVEHRRHQMRIERVMAVPKKRKRTQKAEVVRHKGKLRRALLLEEEEGGGGGGEKEVQLTTLK